MVTYTEAQREQAIAVMMNLVGISESPPYSNRCFATDFYGMVGPWCAMGVSYAEYQVYVKMYGLKSPVAFTTSRGFAWCPSGVDGFKKLGMWAGPKVKPQRGWIVFFDFGKGRASHVGVVLDVLPDGRLVTWECNTNGGGSRDGGSVMIHHRSTNSVVGYGKFNFVKTPAVKPKPDAKPTVPMPKLPNLLVTLELGYDHDVNTVREKARVDATRYVNKELALLLPKWNFPASVKLRKDGKFDGSTAIAVVYFKSWANAIAKMTGKDIPFPVVNHKVGRTTMAVLHMYAVYYRAK